MPGEGSLTIPRGDGYDNLANQNAPPRLTSYIGPIRPIWVSDTLQTMEKARDMKIATTFFALALCASVTPAFAQDAAKARGVWQSETGITRVRVSPCGKNLCGTIVWQKSPSKDVHNPDPAKRARPLVGVELVSGMKPTGPNAWSGSIYNYEDGKTYNGKVELNGSNKLTLAGCVLGGAICQSRTWTKIN